jgi:hypothetical protein
MTNNYRKFNSTNSEQRAYLTELGIVKQTVSDIEFANGILAISSDRQTHILYGKTLPE